MKNMNTKIQKNMVNENMNNVLPGGGFTVERCVETLPGGGFHGGEQKETLPGGGFHGGEQKETLPGGGFHGDETKDGGLRMEKILSHRTPVDFEPVHLPTGFWI